MTEIIEYHAGRCVKSPKPPYWVSNLAQLKERKALLLEAVRHTSDARASVVTQVLLFA